MMSFEQRIQDIHSRDKCSDGVLMDERENGCDKTEGNDESPANLEENDEVLNGFSALALDNSTAEASFPIASSTEETKAKEAQIKETRYINQQLNELNIIINQNREEYLSKKGDSEIRLAFKNVNHKEDGKNMIQEHDKSKINALFEKVAKYTNDFPDDKKEEIQKIFKKIDRHAEKNQLTQGPRSSGNTTGETKTVNTSTQVVLVESHGQPVNISAIECVIIIDSNVKLCRKLDLLSSEPFKTDLKNLIKDKDGTFREISEGSIKILVRFNSEKSLKKFEAEWKEGITEKEIYELLLKHKIIAQEDKINVTIKPGNGALLNVSMEELEKLKGETIDLVPFMVAAYSCKNIEELDASLASTLKKRITFAGLQSRYVDQIINTGDLEPGSMCLFPTLLHFAASYGLSKTYRILLQKPESNELQKMNTCGETPMEIINTAYGRTHSFPYYLRRKTDIYDIQRYHTAHESNVLSDRYGKDFREDRDSALGQERYSYEEEFWEDTDHIFGESLAIQDYTDIYEEESESSTEDLYFSLQQQVSQWKQHHEHGPRPSRHIDSRKCTKRHASLEEPTLKKQHHGARYETDTNGRPASLEEHTRKVQHPEARLKKVIEDSLTDAEILCDINALFERESQQQSPKRQHFGDSYEKDIEVIPSSLEQHIPKQQCLVNTIVTGMHPTDVVMSEDGNLLVAGLTNAIHVFKQSGEYVSKITLPSNVKVYKMCIMKNEDLIVISDDGNKCITLCEPDGLVIKSIGKGVLRNPYGIHVDEKLNVVYVADIDKACVFMFSIHSGQIIRRVGSKGHSEGELYGTCTFSVTNEGYLIVADCGNDRLQLFNNEGKFIEVLVGEGDQDGKVNYPHAVIIDKDNNMLVTSENKLQLFNCNGHFIKRIDQGGLDNPFGLSIVSYNPRSVAVANYGGGNIIVFNY